VEADGLVPPIARYAQAVRFSLQGAREMVCISGQVASDHSGAVVGVGHAEAQARQVFHNLRRVLESVGADVSALVSVTIYLTRRDDFAAVSAVRDSFFVNHRASSTLVVVAGLAVPEHLVEISAIAVL
jgi:enamine deaminase RidA (YjgF/YER057c/UK114 family)